MSRVRPPIGGEFEELLRRLEAKVDAIGRRNLATVNQVIATPAQSGNAWNTAFGNSSVDRAFSHLLVANASRVAFMFDARVGDPARTGTFRLVAVNNSFPYGTAAAMEPWQILDEWTRGVATFGFHTANIELPEEVRDGQQWNLSVHGKVDAGGSGAGNDFWEIRAWALILTDDAAFLPERGD